MKKKLVSFAIAVSMIAQLMPISVVHAQSGTPVSELYFPDEEFRAYVKNTLDTNKDGYLSETEVYSVKTIDCSNLGIENLEGIECFVNLKNLNCSHNMIDEVDTGYLTELESLDCSWNAISELNLGSNQKLKKLVCSYNSLSSLSLASCPEIEWLECDFNENLTWFDITFEPKGTYNYSSKTLKHLSCAQYDNYAPGSSNRGSFDGYYFFNLEYLDLSGNPISYLNLQDIEKLKVLRCKNCGLNTLNLKYNPNLEELDCSWNNLYEFQFAWGVDFSDFKQLKIFDCSGNHISSLDLSSNTKLEELYCSDNTLTSIDIRNFPDLETFHCERNNISKLDVSQNPKLMYLWCGNNNIGTKIDTSKCSKLVSFNCEDNNIQRLDLSNNSELFWLSCASNNLTGLYVSNLSKLEHLDITDNDISEIDVTNNPMVELLADSWTTVIRGYLDRISGQNRFDTSIEAAKALKKAMGVSKFDNIVIASGTAFPDALAGSYLASKKKAPVLLTANNDAVMNSVANYIKSNTKSNGTVYILGGTGAVPDAMETKLNGSGLKIKRLAGDNRYDTNIKILEEAGVSDGDDILVCTGLGFADSLSASSLGKPILLVPTSVLESQQTYLNTLGTNCHFYAIGGTGAVNAAVFSKLKKYGKTERIAGSNRFETSVKIAEKFFDNPDKFVLAYAQNFPDGLSAGPLANTYGAPLILTQNAEKALQAAKDYTFEYAHGSLKNITLIGGETLISDSSAASVYREAFLPDGDVIIDEPFGSEPEVGDTVFFGSYEQNNDLANGKEDIEWLVINKDNDGNCFVVSKYILDYIPYGSYKDNASAHVSYLKNYLNKDFYDLAFSPDEKEYILHSKPNENDIMEPSVSVTDDKVFLLSVNEVETFFELDMDFTNEEVQKYAMESGFRSSCGTKMTEYAYAKSGFHPASIDISSQYRSPYKEEFVRYDGNDCWMLRVAEDVGQDEYTVPMVCGTGNTSPNGWLCPPDVLRPALWISASCFEKM